MRRILLRLKDCPRCGGDILIDKVYEDSELCLQCGFRGWRKPAYHAGLLDREVKERKYDLKELDKLLLKSQ